MEEQEMLTYPCVQRLALQRALVVFTVQDFPYQLQDNKA